VSDPAPAQPPASPEAPKPPGLLHRVLGPALSPHGLVSRALLITVTFLILHLAGLRDYTTIISGTSPTGNLRDYCAVALGVLYAFMYVVVTMLAPVLIIAAVILAGLFLLSARGAARPPEGS
jgi:hypothetical protein